MSNDCGCGPMSLILLTLIPMIDLLKDCGDRLSRISSFDIGRMRSPLAVGGWRTLAGGILKGKDRKLLRTAVEPPRFSNARGGGPRAGRRAGQALRDRSQRRAASAKCSERSGNCVTTGEVAYY